MKKKSSSPFGFLMDTLNIPTTRLAKVLHVDSSLISKWRSGDRKFSVKSSYYNDCLHYFLEESRKSDHRILISALKDLYPTALPSDESDLCALIFRLFSVHKLPVATPAGPVLLSDGQAIMTTAFYGNEGRRTAIFQLLNYAEALPSPGTLLFIDSEEYGWLLEDSEYAHAFVKKMNVLLNRGFRAKFLIHFTSHRERFVRFFEICNYLVFHRNIEWFFYDTYDENVMNYSLFVLNKALSLLSLSSLNNSSSTIAFTDASSVLAHEALAKTIIQHGSPLFVNFPVDECGNVVEYIRVIRKRGAIYAYLPAPLFVAAEGSLLREILENNRIPASQIEQCLQVNRRMRNIVQTQFRGLRNTPERIVQIFQLEEMLNRLNFVPFTSCSLSLFGGKNVRVTKKTICKASSQFGFGPPRTRKSGNCLPFTFGLRPSSGFSGNELLVQAKHLDGPNGS